MFRPERVTADSTTPLDEHLDRIARSGPALAANQLPEAILAPVFQLERINELRM
jgi:hypothetical protein